MSDDFFDSPNGTYLTPSQPPGPDRRWLIVGGVIALVVVFGLIFSTCGGDGDDDSQEAVESETTTPTSAPSPTPTPDPGPSPAEITSQLQADLAELGFYEGPISGVYDDATEAAVRAFQEFAGIGVDGVVGPQTAAAIDVALGRAGQSTTTLQTALAELCYYDGEIDGDYGPATTEAVRQFQIDSGLTPDGSYGPATADALVAAWPSRPAECAGQPTEPAEGDDGVDADEPADGDDEPLDAITATSDEFAAGEIVFNADVQCVLGPDDSGSVEGTADDGTSIVVTIDGTASSVVIDGPSASYAAPFLSISNDQSGLTIEAGPPPVTVLVVLSFCTEV